jgi:mono/diheme cytochrome c family protein
MKRLKKILLGVLGVVVVLVSGVGIYACVQASAFDASMETVYDVPLPKLERSTDASALARGKHLAEATLACATSDCHGTDLGGGKEMAMGPLGTLTGPNITGAGLGVAYSDAELARLLKHGVKKDGRSLKFMPVQDMRWLPPADVAAVISYLRTVPPVDKPNGPVRIGTLGKVLDRRDMIVLDVARRIDHTKEFSMNPEPTAAYGKELGRMCTGCHGEKLSGGPIPGAPSDLPVPLNITPHETGLKDWSFADFEKLMRQGDRKNGKKLDPFMPIAAFGKLDDVEMKAIWEYLRTVAPVPTGNR